MTTSLLRHWVRAPFENFRLFSNFTRQDFFAQFSASIGGVFWLFLTPLVTLLIYAFVFSYVFRMRAPAEYGEINFIIFLMLGYLPWFPFAESMGRAPSLLLEKAPLITKVMFPVQIIPLAGTVIPYLTHAIAVLLLLGYLALDGYLNPMWLMLPLVYGLQFLFTLGLVTVLSAFCVFLRDIQQLIALVVTAWFFLTPIIYPLSLIQSESIQQLFLINPMFSFVSLYRDIVLTGQFESPHLTVAASTAVISYCVGGWLFMRIKHAFGDVL